MPKKEKKVETIKIAVPTVGAGTRDDPLKPKYEVETKNAFYKMDGTVVVSVDKATAKKLLKNKDVKKVE